MESEQIDARQAKSVSRLPRRTVTGGLVGGGALAALLAALGSRPTQVAAQEATPVTIADFEELGLTVGPLFSIVVEDLPPPPVEMSLVRTTSQPGDGDLEDYFTFPGPSRLHHRVRADHLPLRDRRGPLHHSAIGGHQRAGATVPADIPLGPGEGLYIPANSPDSFTNPGPDPRVELDVTLWPVGAQATPAPSPTA